MWSFTAIRSTFQGLCTLLWRHNDWGGVSDHQPYDCLLSRLFKRRSKKTSKIRVTGLCVGNSPGTGEFPAQMASNAENASIWWRHHVRLDPCYVYFVCIGRFIHILQACFIGYETILDRCEANLNDMGKWIIGIHKNWWYMHNKINHSDMSVHGMWCNLCTDLLGCGLKASKSSKHTPSHAITVTAALCRSPRVPCSKLESICSTMSLCSSVHKPT